MRDVTGSGAAIPEACSGPLPHRAGVGRGERLETSRVIEGG